MTVAPLPIRWLTAFIDLPASGHGSGSEFWARVTGSRLGAARGPAGEFATLHPPEGDPCVRAQRVAGAGGAHVDLHVPDVMQATEDAAAIGATVLAARGCSILRSPGGVSFCLVAHHGESLRPPPVSVDGGPPTLLDQVSFDVAAADYDAETSFWSTLTGWHVWRGELGEFAALDRPSGLPLRLVVQRRESVDDDRPAAHLDIACGAHVATIAEQHVAAGATRSRDHTHWTTMTDPAGLEYCLTRRDPFGGGFG